MTNLNETIVVYSPNGVKKTDIEVCVGSTLTANKMQDDNFKVKFTLEEKMTFERGCYAIIKTDGGKDKRYVVVEQTYPTYVLSNGGFEYELRFDAWYMVWKRYRFNMNLDYGGVQTSFSYTNYLIEHVRLLINELYRLKEDGDVSIVLPKGIVLHCIETDGDTSKVRVDTYDITDGVMNIWNSPNKRVYEGSVDKDTNNASMLVEDVVKYVSYDCNAFECLGKMCEENAYDCEWWMDDDMYLHFGRCEYGDLVVLKQHEQFEEMSRSSSSDEYGTRLIAFGSQTNVPTKYKKELVFDLTEVRKGDASDNINQKTDDGRERTPNPLNANETKDITIQIGSVTAKKDIVYKITAKVSATAPTSPKYVTFDSSVKSRLYRNYNGVVSLAFETTTYASSASVQFNDVVMLKKDDSLSYYFVIACKNTTSSRIDTSYDVRYTSSLLCVSSLDDERYRETIDEEFGVKSIVFHEEEYSGKDEERTSTYTKDVARLVAKNGGYTFLSFSPKFRVEMPTFDKFGDISNPSMSVNFLVSAYKNGKGIGTENYTKTYTLSFGDMTIDDSVLVNLVKYADCSDGDVITIKVSFSFTLNVTAGAKTGYYWYKLKFGMYGATNENVIDGDFFYRSKAYTLFRDINRKMLPTYFEEMEDNDVYLLNGGIMVGKYTEEYNSYLCICGLNDYAYYNYGLNISNVSTIYIEFTINVPDQYVTMRPILTCSRNGNLIQYTADQQSKQTTEATKTFLFEVNMVADVITINELTLEVGGIIPDTLYLSGLKVYYKSRARRSVVTIRETGETFDCLINPLEHLSTADIAQYYYLEEDENLTYYNQLVALKFSKYDADNVIEDNVPDSLYTDVYYYNNTISNYDRRLLLPEDKCPRNYIDSERIKDASGNTKMNEVVEVVKIFDDIYPSLSLTIDYIMEYYVNEAYYGDNNVKSTKRVKYFRLLMKKSTLNFQKKYLTSQQLQCQFQSGLLSGMTFDVDYEGDTKRVDGSGTSTSKLTFTFEGVDDVVSAHYYIQIPENTVRIGTEYNSAIEKIRIGDAGAKYVATTSKENDLSVVEVNFGQSVEMKNLGCVTLLDNEGNQIASFVNNNNGEEYNVFCIKANETYGIQLPNETLYPKSGDKFVLINYKASSLMEMGIVAQAEERLYTRAMAYLDKISLDAATYNVTLSPEYAKALIEQGKFPRIGQKILLVGDIMDEERETRIIGYDMPLDIPYDNPKLVIGESLRYSWRKSMEKRI